MIINTRKSVKILNTKVKIVGKNDDEEKRKGTKLNYLLFIINDFRFSQWY
jgi:hypothetical protein